MFAPRIMSRNKGSVLVQKFSGDSSIIVPVDCRECPFMQGGRCKVTGVDLFKLINNHDAENFKCPKKNITVYNKVFA